MPTSLNIFQETEREGTLPKSFYETSITLIPKLDKDTSKNQKRELQPTSLMKINTKILKKMMAN
jgi:hypothetical protein